MAMHLRSLFGTLLMGSILSSSDDGESSVLE